MIGERYEPKDILALEGIPANEVLDMLDGQELTRDGKVIMKFERKDLPRTANLRTTVYFKENPDVSRNFIVSYFSNLSFYGQIDRILKDFGKTGKL